MISKGAHTVYIYIPSLLSNDDITSAVEIWFRAKRPCTQRDDFEYLLSSYFMSRFGSWEDRRMGIGGGRVKGRRKEKEKGRKRRKRKIVLETFRWIAELRSSEILVCFAMLWATFLPRVKISTMKHYAYGDGEM